MVVIISLIVNKYKGDDKEKDDYGAMSGAIYGAFFMGMAITALGHVFDFEYVFWDFSFIARLIICTIPFLISSCLEILLISDEKFKETFKTKGYTYLFLLIISLIAGLLSVIGVFYDYL